MAITKIHAIKVRLGDAINYIENPDKTDGQELISGYNTAPQTAVLDFSVTAAMARKARNTSAKKQGNLAYHMIQSFSPDDAVTPERAHELGRKLAMEFTDGKFEFVVATHINKDSIHNHIIINAVSFYDYKKLRTVPYRTAQQIRSISDRLCMESQLSVIKDPQQLGQLYPTYIQKKRTTSNRTEVRKKLNFCLERATNYAQFLQMAQELGISVCQRGKHMTYLLEGAGRAIRDTSLADTDKFTYTGLVERLEDNAAEQQFIRERIAKIFPSVSTFTDFIKQLQSEGVKARVKKQTGQLLYKAADLDGTWIPADALGDGFTLAGLESVIKNKSGMADNGLHSAADFDKQISAYQREEMKLRNEIAELRSKSKIYAATAHNLQACRTYKSVWLEYASKPLAQKDTFYKQNEAALQAYSRAASQLDKMGISLGTKPEKVRQLVTETESRIADLIAELEIVRKTNQTIQEDKEKIEQIQSG